MKQTYTIVSVILFVCFTTIAIAQTDSTTAAEFSMLNLNTTPEDDFMTVPNVGETMAHEFEEYRPYISIQQFRRDMSKYVSDEQIAAYEAYVYVPIDVNAADSATLQQIPALDEAIADALIAERPYDSNANFLAAMGDRLSEDQVSYAANFLSLPEFSLLNLNTTPEADFMTVPNVGETMAHEFEEYRPYISIQQFRRDISKYVSDEQIAAYEQYVYVPIDVNAADAETLMQIPGVDDMTAELVVSARPFESSDDFLAALSEHLWADQVSYAANFLSPPEFTLLNLNTTPEADFMTVPNVGETMAHEFEEYRPYISIQQFRRDMSKYVSDEQIAAYEAYVYVPIDVNAADAETLQQIPEVGADIAEALIAERPFESNDDFLGALGEYLTTEQVEYAGDYLAPQA